MVLFLRFLMFCIAVSTLNISSAQPTNFNVLNYGAKGDGQTDDSKAFLMAWKAVCENKDSPRPTLEVPTAKTFLLKALMFQGPCVAKSIGIKVLGGIVAAPKEEWESEIGRGWLGFQAVDGLYMDGSGKIDGQGSGWWSSPSSLRPTALRITNCNGTYVNGLTSINPPGNHISIDSASSVTLSHISLIAPSDSPNTDGIDIASSSDVEIRDSFIGSGDDCIAINGGSSNIRIQRLNCGPGHGISVGSLGKNGARETVEDIHVSNCTFNGTSNGARIKTWQGGSGFARNITYNDIKLIGAGNPIIIDQFYCNGQHDCQNKTGAVAISDVTYSNFRGTSQNKEAIRLDCDGSVGCVNIVMDRVHIKTTVTGERTNAYCKHVKGKFSRVVPQVNCLA